MGAGRGDGPVDFGEQPLGGADLGVGAGDGEGLAVGVDVGAGEGEDAAHGGGEFLVGLRGPGVAEGEGPVGGGLRRDGEEEEGGDEGAHRDPFGAAGAGRVTFILLTFGVREACREGGGQGELAPKAGDGAKLGEYAMGFVERGDDGSGGDVGGVWGAWVAREAGRVFDGRV